MLATVRISSKTQGVLLENIDKEHAISLVNELIGADGIKRITIEWEPKAKQEHPTNHNLSLESVDVNLNYAGSSQYPTKECEISDTGKKAGVIEDTPPSPPGPPPTPKETGHGPDGPGPNPDETKTPPPTYLGNPEDPDQVPSETEPGEHVVDVGEDDTPEEPPMPERPPEPKEPYIFKELPKITKGKLGPYIDMGVKNLGYHDQPDSDKIVICFGTTKVYTCMADIDKLADTNDAAEVKGISITKQIAIRRFKRWTVENRQA